MDFNLLIQRKRERFEQLEREIADPALFENRNRAGEIMREHANVKALLAKWTELSQARMQLADNRELANSSDADLAQMAQEEIPALEIRVADLEREMQVALLPPDENENRDAIIEIRAGTGGSEAAIFAADLYRMYSRYAESAGLKIESMDSSPSELGGLKEIIFKVSGESVFRKLRFESGVHRVQRVPATEAQGRIHTSTATVAVLPEAEEVDLELKPEFRPARSFVARTVGANRRIRRKRSTFCGLVSSKPNNAKKRRNMPRIAEARSDRAAAKKKFAPTIFRRTE
jgi:peptide chain release factor 1